MLSFMAEDEKTDAAVRELPATALPSFFLLLFLFLLLPRTRLATVSNILFSSVFGAKVSNRGARGSISSVSLDSDTNVTRRAAPFLSNGLTRSASNRVRTRRLDIRYRCFIHKRHV